MANTIKLKQIDQVQLAAFVNDLIDGTGATYTASRAVVTDASGDITTSSVTSTELGYVSGVTSAIQTQLDSKLGNFLTSAYVFVGNGSNVATGVAISGDITLSNAGVVGISSGVIVNADVNASAAIALSKLAAVTASRALVSDASGFVSASSVTTTELGYVSGVTSAIQTQLDAKQPLDTQLTSLAGLAYTSNALKVVRVNAGETAFELATISTSVAWGSITGTLSNQTDLQSALDAKFTLPSLTSGSVLFSNGTTIAQDNSNLFWDDTNNRLGIGTNSPSSSLHVIIGSSSVVGGIIKGAASQSADLTQWQNSSSTVLAKVDSAGNATFLNMFTDATNNSVALGREAGDALTSTGTNNVAIGYQALTTATTSDNNTSIGYRSCWTLSSGEQNVAIGGESMQNSTTASYNVAIGFNAAGDGTFSGNNNTLIGYNCASSITSGSGNCLIGANLMLNLTSGSNNVAFGSTILGSVTTQNTLCVGIGGTVLGSNTSGTNNIGIGFTVMNANSTGANNIAIGGQALAGNTTADENVGIGYGANQRNQTGGNNTSVGTYAGYYVQGAQNTFIGKDCGYGVDATSSFNGSTMLGYRAGYVITTGANNLFLGRQAGDNVTTGAKNIIVGTDIDAPSATTSNQLNIGNIIFGTGVSGTGTTIAGLVGIGTTSPASTFDIEGSFSLPTVSKTADYTAAVTDFTILVDASGGAVTITIPAATGVAGRIYVVKKTDSSGNAVTLARSSSDTIDGATSQTITTQYASYTIQSDGSSAWHIL